MAKGIFRRYIWLVSVVRAARNGITYEEINEKWRRSSLNDDGTDIPKRTFRNWIAALPEELDVEIKCEKRSPYRYYIDGDDVESNDLLKWSLEVFTVGSMVSENKAIHNRIMLENIPTANETLNIICSAMRNNHKIWMRYHKFGQKEAKEYSTSPYAVKLCQNRWYLIAHSEKYSEEFTVGLDRITEIRELDESFVLPEDYSPRQKFENCIGVNNDDKYPVENVRIRVEGYLSDYVKTLPLHHTQQIEEENADYTIFSYQLRVNYELVDRLLAYGPLCEVLAPQSLRDDMKQAFNKALKQYK